VNHQRQFKKAEQYAYYSTFVIDMGFVLEKKGSIGISALPQELNLMI
jgi:hypothetical protein